MFYYPTVLHYRTGCFATIWLASTRGKALTRRDYLKVNVPQTCDEIMKYLLVQAPPPRPGLPRPRFSLLLSSHLQYGVVLVYHRQCGILIEELQQTIERLLRHHQPKIDLVADSRITHTLPSAVDRQTDPLFGVVNYDLPSPSSHIQLFSTEFPETAGIMLTDGFTASPESITLREQMPPIISQDEFAGVELPLEGLVEMLLEQPDNYIEGMARDQQMETERLSPQQDQEQVRQAEVERGQDTEQEREVERAAEMERTQDMAGTILSADQLQVTASTSSKEPTLLAEEGIATPMEVLDISGERTPMSVHFPSPSPVRLRPREERVRQRSESPSLELLELPPIEKQRRRRQLIFIDQNTQISQDELRAQIDDVHFETRALAEVFVDTPAMRTLSPDELLSNPCCDLPQDILEIWRQGATLCSSLRTREEVEMEASEEEAEEERELGRRETEEVRAEVERETDILEMASERELSSKDISGTSLPHPEIPRELERSLSQEGSVTSLPSLELSDKDVSTLEPIELPRSPTRPLLGHLEDIPEEIPEPPKAGVRATEDEWRVFFQPLEMQDEVTFLSLLPLTPSRDTVAVSFWYLLESVSLQRVIVHQDEPYGDIFVSRGHLFNQVG